MSGLKVYYLAVTSNASDVADSSSIQRSLLHVTHKKVLCYSLNVA